MSALTLWVVITICSTFSGSTIVDYRAFPTLGEAVEFATPDPEKISVNCTTKVYEAHLSEVAKVEEMEVETLEIPAPPAE